MGAEYGEQPTTILRAIPQRVVRVGTETTKNATVDVLGIKIPTPTTPEQARIVELMHAVGSIQDTSFRQEIEAAQADLELVLIVDLELQQHYATVLQELLEEYIIISQDLEIQKRVYGDSETTLIAATQKFDTHRAELETAKGSIETSFNEIQSVAFDVLTNVQNMRQIINDPEFESLAIDYGIAQLELQNAQYDFETQTKELEKLIRKNDILANKLEVLLQSAKSDVRQRDSQHRAVRRTRRIVRRESRWSRTKGYFSDLGSAALSGGMTTPNIMMREAMLGLGAGEVHDGK